MQHERSLLQQQAHAMHHPPLTRIRPAIYPAQLLPLLPPSAPAQHAPGAGQVEEGSLAGKHVIPGRQQPPLLPKLACRFGQQV